MGKIFKLASRVWVWLGEHADDSGALFQLWPQTAPSAIQKFRRAFSNLRSSGLVISTSELERRQNIWICFLSRPYFRRTWVVQELVLAQSLLIHCGDSVTTWDKLIRFDLASYHFPTFDGIPVQVTGKSGSSVSLQHPRNCGDRYFTNLVAQLNIIERYRKTHRSSEFTADEVLNEEERVSSGNLSKAFDPSSTITMLAHTFKDKQCSNVRDKIYALISLENDPFSQPIIPDYSLTPYQTLLSLARQRAEVEWQRGRSLPPSPSNQVLEDQPRREAVQIMAANFANTLKLADDGIHFLQWGHLRYLRGKPSLTDILRRLDILIEDEQRLRKARALVRRRQFMKAMALYQSNEALIAMLRSASHSEPDIYDVFLTIARQRIARIAPNSKMDASGTDNLNHAVQVAAALGKATSLDGGHGKWFPRLPHDTEVVFDFGISLPRSLESTILALQVWVSRQRARVRTEDMGEKPELRPSSHWL